MKKQYVSKLNQFPSIVCIKHEIDESLLLSHKDLYWVHGFLIFIPVTYFMTLMI